MLNLMMKWSKVRLNGGSAALPDSDMSFVRFRFSYVSFEEFFERNGSGFLWHDVILKMVVKVKIVEVIYYYPIIRESLSAIENAHHYALNCRFRKHFFDRITGLTGRLNAG